MSSISKLFTSLILVIFSAVVQAHNYYVCNSTGSDSNLGLSESKPFKTYDKAMSNFNNLVAGSGILFCRGDTFTVDRVIRLSNSKCTASKPCTIGAYGDEAEANPIISSPGLHAFNFENGGDARQDGGYVVENLTLISSQKGDAGIRLYNDVDDVIISNVHIEGFNLGVYSAGSNKIASGNPANGMNDRLIVKNSTIINNKKIGFLGACNDCLIEDNYFENNGTHPSLDHNIYLAQKVVPARGITIRNNTLYRSAIVDGKCQGVSLVGHGLLEDVLIENNIVKEEAGKVTGGCWGISIDPGYSKVDESFKNITIRNNKIINVGGNAIGCASCDGVTVEGNEIIDEAQMLTAGIKIPVRAENTTKSNNILIKNNKIIVSHVNAAGVWLGGENISQVNGNVIHLPSNTRSECISRNQANFSINISLNTCNKHNGVSIMDPTDDGIPNQEDKQVADSPEEQSPNEEEQEIVDNSPVGDDSNNQEQVIVDNSPIDQQPEIVVNLPVQEENPNQDINRNENPDVVPNPTNNVQTPPTDVAGNNGASDEFTTTQPPKSTVANTDSNGSKVGVNEQQNYVDSSTSLLNNKSRNAAGGGSSGGGSSKSKTSSISNNELAVADDVITYSTPVTSIDTSTSVISVETEQMDISTGLPKSDTESSKYSVKVKDVIEASRNTTEVTDVTQCRAYAAGKCLMK